MSIDLDWGQLDEELCSRALAGINEALKTCKKPNFLGDIRATSFSLGKVSPQLEIVEIRDVFEEFLHVEHEDEEDHVDDYDDDDMDDEDGNFGQRDDVYTASGTKNAGPLSPTNSYSGFSSSTYGGRPLSTPGLYTPTAGLWMHRNSNASSATASTSASAHNPSTGYPFPRFGSAHIHSEGHAHPLRSHGDEEDGSGSYTGSMYTEGLKNAIHHRNTLVNDPIHPHPRQHPRPPRTAESQSAVPQNGASSPTSGISLQLHFRVKYLGNMSISLSTTLKVNYPSPSFMSLPLNLRITGLAFEGLLVVAYEGDKKRLHVSVLDESDPDRTKIVKGANLLKHAFVESEVGQADKLVLKDVAKVEQFVLEMARKALQVCLRFTLSAKYYCALFAIDTWLLNKPLPFWLARFTG